MQTTQVVSGLRLRPYGGEPDLADIVRIENLEAEADSLPERTNVGDMTAQFAHPNESFDPRRDVTLAEVDGQVVAVASRNVVDTTDGLREYRVNGAVDPAWRRRGIGRALLLDNERRMRDLAAAEHGASRRVYGSWSGDSQPASAALLQAAGYGPVRYFFDMVRPHLGEIEDVPLPDGLEIRPIGPDLTRAVWDADIDAFRDHWGGFDHSDEQLQRWLSNPANDLSLWLVAFDGDEVAGGVINSIDPHQNAAMGYKRGWLSSVFTRRQWRRRGLARALIARSLTLHLERGMTSAALGVDAENPSGALGLYEGMGFGVDYRSTAWRKAFER
ncbi:MAG TPA: GNAT family N-acetyltransferase [Candidatus Limnocylindria bacterium]|nr:GNAT family N-acetyltransferase [Candidatus Limnocylindria bacterium]